MSANKTSIATSLNPVSSTARAFVAPAWFDANKAGYGITLLKIILFLAVLIAYAVS